MIVRNYSWQRLTVWKLVVCIVLMSVVWNEFFSYTLNSLSWPRIFHQTSSSEEVKLLLVADPQLQGYHDKYLPYTSLAGIAILDADRYLGHGFSRALSHVKPDVILFLGDLLDEGSQAHMSDYLQYAQRFHAIFQTPQHVQKIYISGDNDVGGEVFSDRKEDWKIKRFKEAFPSDDLTNVKFIDFMQLNVDWIDKFDREKEKSLAQVLARSSAKIKLLLNHWTILDTSNERVAAFSGANGIISAHTHNSKMMTCSRQLLAQNEIEFAQHKDEPKPARLKSCVTDVQPLKDDQVHKVDLRDVEALREFMVPTCSYRMGVPQMGYGAAIIDKNGMMQYTVLWLPSRYHQLYFYAVVLGVVTLLLLVSQLRKLPCR